MILDVKRRPGLDEHQPRATLPRLADVGAGLDPETLRLVAGGDAAGAVGHDWNDGDRLIAQGGLLLLLNGGEEGVEIDDEGAKGHAINFGLGQRAGKKNYTFVLKGEYFHR